jgi:hypothetical protein
MRLWNFSNFEQFEEQVLVSGDSTQSSKVSPRKQKSVTNGPILYSSDSSLKLGMAVAVLALSIPIYTCGNSNFTTMSVPEITSPTIDVATRPPLEVLFGGRFQGEWTREREDRLLALAVDKSSPSPERDRANFIHTAQQESLEDDVPRLQMNDLSKSIRRKG